jgi:hypothetical protein
MKKSLIHFFKSNLNKIKLIQFVCVCVCCAIQRRGLGEEKKNRKFQVF